MLIINYLLKYNWIFKYYLCLIFFLNIFIFYFFFIRDFFKSNKVNELDGSVNDDILNLKYSIIFKKIIKIINNPIIFEYQLKQLKKINVKSDKYIQYQLDLNKITKFDLNIKSKIYYTKIKDLLSTNTNNNNNIDDILIKLMCINF